MADKIIENYQNIKKIIDKITFNDMSKQILLVAVSKKKSAEMILKLHSHGHFHFGENLVPFQKHISQLSSSNQY